MITFLYRQALSFLVQKAFPEVKRYGWNILVWMTQTLNVFAGGDPDETSSSRAGKIKLAAGDDFTWRKHPIAKFVDKVTALFQRKHVIKAIEVDEGKNQVFP